MSLLRLESKQPIIWYQEMAYWLKAWKQSFEYSFLADCHSQVLQQKLKDLEKAFRDGFDRNQPLKRIPVFKKKGLGDSFRYPQGFKLNQVNNKVYLPKLGWVKYYNSRALTGDIKNITVSRRGGHWYVAIQVEAEVVIPSHSSKSIVGLDMGVKRFVTLSDGSYVNPLNSFRKLENKLAFTQRKLSKKTKFSNNWRKQKQRIAKLHEDIANVRLDFLHKLSTKISKSHAMVIVEDLKVRNMSKSAKGTKDQPGKNVRAKAGLNKSIFEKTKLLLDGRALVSKLLCCKLWRSTH